MASHEQAEQRVKTGFIVHLGAYLAVIAGLAILNYTRNPDKLWVLWVAGGWGIGVLMHGVAVHLVPEARERMIQRTSARMDRRMERRAT